MGCRPFREAVRRRHRELCSLGGVGEGHLQNVSLLIKRETVRRSVWAGLPVEAGWRKQRLTGGREQRRETKGPLEEGVTDYKVGNA